VDDIIYYYNINMNPYAQSAFTVLTELHFYGYENGHTGAIKKNSYDVRIPSNQYITRVG
jgi:hypothetical protein